MRVTITTDGGLTGRGIGTASAEVDAKAIEEARPESWAGEYRSDGRDLVRYRLTAGERSVTWTDGAAIPSGLRQLFERVWRDGR